MPMSPFPRNPIFLSTNCIRKYSTTSTFKSSETSSAQEFTPAQDDAAPATTSLDHHPESISCTISPPETFAFLKPTPVVLLTGPFGGNWCYRDTWQASLADQGYQSTSIELSMPPKPLESGDAYIRHFVKVLKTSIETDHSFFPPILIAHGLHALVAQKYVESNPVSALVLVSPFIPDVIAGRFQELSQKLQTAQDSAAKANDAAGSIDAVLNSESTEATAATDDNTSTASTSTAPSSISQGSSTDSPSTQVSPRSEFVFETHADVLAQPGFREKYILPKKAVYEIDRIAQEHLEKEKEELITKQEEAEKEPLEKRDDATVEKVNDGAESGVEKEETLGKDSTPVLDTPEKTQTEEEAIGGSLTEAELDTEALPVQTVESESSIPSPLEQLPLSIYQSIPKSVFEPNFPILLVTSNADELVSTEDVKTHHVLADQVDHIELEDLDDGGHLIMVADNTEWEQGIQGITAWLDSNDNNKTVDMTQQIETQTMDLIASTVEDEKKPVTYRWLSRSMGYSVNVAKKYMEAYLTTVGRGKVHGTYYISRKDPNTGDTTITLVGQDAINGILVLKSQKFQFVPLEPSALKDKAVLSVANTEAIQLQKDKDINLYRIIHNKNVVISKSGNRGIPPSTTTTTLKSSNTTNTLAEKSSSTPTPKSSVTSTPAGNSSGPTSTSTVSAASKAKATPAKSSALNFFGKAATAKPANTSTLNNNKPASTHKPTPVAKPVTNALTQMTSSVNQKRKADSMLNEPRSTPVVSDDDDDEVDSEEERDRRLAMNSMLDQDQGPLMEPTTSSEVLDVTAAKKKQRSAKLLAIDDDDDDNDDAVVNTRNKSVAGGDMADDAEDDGEALKSLSKEARMALEKEKDAQRLALENMMLMDNHTAEDEDSVMVDVEAEDPVPTAPKSTVVSTISNGNGTVTRRVRGYRAVTKKKTSKNERGYLVTESVVVMEPFSEDEIVEEPRAPAVTPAVTPAAAPRSESAKTGPSGSTKKKGAGSGNQSLLNFFSR
ncbi:hypothetical protein BGZ94_002744, partial [Podila epigama]